MSPHARPHIAKQLLFCARCDAAHITAASFPKIPVFKKDAELASGKRAIEQDMIDMLPLLQSLTIVGMIGATFFVYQTFGPRQLSFTFTKREKKEWDELVRGRL